MKDIEKLMSRTLITYFIVLIGIFILKICGLDYFGLDDGNKMLLAIDSFVNKYHLEFLWYTITLTLYTYIVLSISCVDNSKKMKIYTLIVMPLNMISQILKYYFNFKLLFIFTDLLWLFMLEVIYIKFIKKEHIKKHNIINYGLYCIVNIIFQGMSVAIRSIGCSIDYTNFISQVIYNFDYIILSIIAYKLFFLKGGTCLWEVGSFLHLHALLKSLPTKLQNIYANNKKKSKVEKVSDFIYFPLFLLWNVFTVVVILFVAKLNDTFIECLIILSSFWINKTIFGKPFHMKSALSCFIVSNVSYYCLNRITFPCGLSILISIILGLLLAYITSLFVKKKEKQLYRGMTKELYDEYVLEFIDKNSDEYLIGKYYYVDKESEQWIANKLNYSVPSIQKKKYILRDTVKESK